LPVLLGRAHFGARGGSRPPAVHSPMLTMNERGELVTRDPAPIFFIERFETDDGGELLVEVCTN
jgi:hypothetical protein